MKILYIGDIMGGIGVEVVEKVLPKLKTQYKIEFVVAQGENVTDGKGISLKDFQHLKAIGVNFITGGNWSGYRDDINASLSDPAQPIVRPANYLEGTPGIGWKYAKTSKGEVLVISLLGKIVGKDSNKPTENPLKAIDKILEQNIDHERAATIVNFHGDYSSEKRIIGYYLDGKVSAVVGDHWHIPTADAMVLPNGTAHITDVGMCGSLHSSLGVKLGSVMPRWRNGVVTKNELETSGATQFNAVLININTETMLADDIKPINIYGD